MAASKPKYAVEIRVLDVDLDTELYRTMHPFRHPEGLIVARRKANEKLNDLLTYAALTREFPA